MIFSRLWSSHADARGSSRTGWNVDAFVQYAAMGEAPRQEADASASSIKARQSSIVNSGEREARAASACPNRAGGTLSSTPERNDPVGPNSNASHSMLSRGGAGGTSPKWKKRFSLASTSSRWSCSFSRRTSASSRTSACNALRALAREPQRGTSSPTTPSGQPVVSAAAAAASAALIATPGRGGGGPNLFSRV
eukprot:scaffold224865_cov31-Tisochrysis_lutea.AAC.2